ncbi:MAG TPA: EF-hand domain-containing protein [Sphingomonadaceae bacterium]|nr:EF-hand domain-containing protein [Sphingomonadaceae bacterium]
MKKVMIGASIAALFALPALAADQGNVRPEQAPATRADMLAQTAKRFAALDANKDGAITQAELDQAREAMKTRRAEQRKQRMDERFTRLDTDKNGQLSKAEFDAGYAARREGPRVGTEDARPRRFHRGHRGYRFHRGGPGMAGGTGGFLARLDANKDGKVTLAEFQAGPIAMFDRVDANKDGTITPAERQAARQAMRDAWKAKGK